MRTLLDTNVLLRSAQPAHPLRQVAADAVAALRAQRAEPCLVPQNLYEYWVVCTRPAAQNGLGMTCPAIETEIAKYKQLFTILDDTPGIFVEWERLVAAHQVLGKTAHDTRLVAAMRVHGIQQILTFNVRDFQRYPSIVVLSPHAVPQPISPPAIPPQSNP